MQSILLGLSFEESYEILNNASPYDYSDQDEGGWFDQEMLWVYEQELREEQGMEFVWSSKEVSVIDCYCFNKNQGKHGKSSKMRCLIFNDRPNLIQSSMEIKEDDDEEKDYLPPSLTGEAGTHLGGLALAASLLELLLGMEERRRKEAIVIGAGACTVPMVLSKVSKVSGGCMWYVRAIEPSADVLYAAKHYFGASSITTTGKGGQLELIQSTGEEYLTRLIRLIGEPNEGKESATTATTRTNKCQLLIVDAEDGGGGVASADDLDDIEENKEEEEGLVAPPQSMQSIQFWRDLVVPCLDDSEAAAIAINVIGSTNARDRFRRILRESLPTHYQILSLKVPAAAGVTERHTLVFAISPRIGLSDVDRLRRLEQSLVAPYLDQPHLWVDELEDAIRMTDSGDQI